MAQSVNLIPKQEFKLQQEKKIVTVSTIITFVLTLITIIASVTIFALNRDLNSKLSSTENELTKLRTNISNESNIEIVARNLDKKSQVLSEILQNSPLYSNLLKELYVRKPLGVDISDISIRASSVDTIEVSGKSDTYLLVAEFLSNILNEKNNYSGTKFSELFTDANLNNVSLDTDGSPFSMTIKFDRLLLMEEL